MSEDTHARSLAKTMSWRIGGTIVTSALVFLLTRRWEITLAVGGMEFFVKSLAFYIHERIWLRIRWGRNN